MRINRLDGWGVGWRIVDLLDPRRVQKALARHELLACVHRHMTVEGLRAVAADEHVVRRGQPGQSMFVVVAGVVEVRVPDINGAPRAAKARGPDSSFGEMSLLTGAPRSADVVAVLPMVLFEIAGSTLPPRLAARPSLADALSRTAAANLASDARLRENQAQPAVPARTLAEQIAASMRALFGR